MNDTIRISRLIVVFRIRKQTRFLLFGIFSGIFLLSFHLLPDQTTDLFASEDLLEITLTGDADGLMSNRTGEALYFDFELQYRRSPEVLEHFPVKVRTRGHFRRLENNCLYPPLMLNFQSKEVPENSIFYGHDKLKLVVPCRGEKYVVQEYLIYKLYNLLTPLSFRARLVKVNLTGDESRKGIPGQYGILLEDEDQMAERNGGQILKKDLVRPREIDLDNFLDLAIFQYLIGNTDWSIQYRQNIRLVSLPNARQPLAVPYDFDHSGMVMAPYARPAPELNLASVRNRRYRGYCQPDMAIFEERLAYYRAKKEELRLVYINCPYLDEGSRKRSLKYLDEFFEIIEDPKSWQKALSYPCRDDKTSKVVIRGLKE